MAIKKIQIRPEGTNDYGDILYPETSADMVIDTATKVSMTKAERDKLNGIEVGARKLSNVLDIKQATKIEFDEHLAEFASFRPSNPTARNLAAFDNLGNLIDSGKSADLKLLASKVFATNTSATTFEISLPSNDCTELYFVIKGMERGTTQATSVSFDMRIYTNVGLPRSQLLLNKVDYITNPNIVTTLTQDYVKFEMDNYNNNNPLNGSMYIINPIDGGPTKTYCTMAGTKTPAKAGVNVGYEIMTLAPGRITKFDFYSQYGYKAGATFEIWGR